MMRALALSLALIAAPAAAADVPRQVATPAPADTREIDRVLNDPATVDTLTRAMQSLSGAFLNLPIGEVEAAIEGRTPTAADKRRTIRDAGRADDPNFDRNVARQLAEGRAVMQSSMRAMAQALPAMRKSMSEMSRTLEQAIANMPSPAYPKR
jgi:hypothetical protein